MLGNITSKSDVATGAFTYGLNAGPNALTRVNGNTGAIPTVMQDIEYSSFNKVARITEGNSEVRFTGLSMPARSWNATRTASWFPRKSMSGFMKRK
ncbi:MAG: hypothetical protein PHI28_15195 [Mangrovibacterium sp.]|nr:hypothetical protein [Mangrovibacterium sp.]